MVKRILGMSVLMIALFIVGSYMVLNAAQYHRNYLRNKVGSQVIMLVGERGGGTGFSIRTPKGKVYTLTNSHICELADNRGYLVAESDVLPIPVKVLKVDKIADLCLVQNTPDREGLVVSNNALESGNEMAVVGHPMLLPLALSRGELLGYQDIEMATKSLQDDSEKCPSNQRTVETLFGSVCIIKYHVGITNAVVLGGNSGSPVVNFYGEVVGVLFAEFSESHWGIIVPLKEIQRFLKDF